jgi:pimeloyl-ACP methyl ester carboxylesterase
MALIVASLLMLVARAACAAPTIELLEVPARPGVAQPALLVEPETPRAFVLLFAGGNGGVRFARDPATGQMAPASFNGNFLVRTRFMFADEGLAAVVIGAPSDRAMLDDAFRTSAEHAQDIGAVVRALRKRRAIPVWLVGTSRGTLSAAAAALQLGRAVDGVVLTATLASVADLAVDRFQVPVLVVHHREDRCAASDFRDLRRLTGKLNAPRQEVIPMSGGRSQGPLCEAFAYHGFNGVERETVAAIAAWMQLP